MMGYATLTGLAQVGTVIEGRPLRVNDVLFSLVFDPKKDPDCVFIYGDLGVISEQQRVEQESALLAANMDFYADYGACVAISPTNGHAILCLNAPLDTLTPQGLHDRLKSAAMVAKAWPGACSAQGRNKGIVGF